MRMYSATVTMATLTSCPDWVCRYENHILPITGTPARYTYTRHMTITWWSRDAPFLKRLQVLLVDFEGKDFFLLRRKDILEFTGDYWPLRPGPPHRGPSNQDSREYH